MATKSSRRGRLTSYDMTYLFNEEEKLQLGQDLVLSLEEITTKEAEYKKVQKQWKDDIDWAKGCALGLRYKVKSGSELRPVAARLVINMTDGIREYYAVDSDELLGTEPMQDGDEQLTINDLD
jgi:hypothetical protein